MPASFSAWIAARVPYQQTEVYRFGNRIVDDWEGRVNAWPLDEGLIDYVDTVPMLQASIWRIPSLNSRPKDAFTPGSARSVPVVYFIGTVNTRRSG